MKATELMIGDLVIFKAETPKMCKVVSIDTDNGNYIRQSLTDTYYTEDCFEPIPLTAEILEKNGFILIDEKDKCYRWEYAEGVYVNADFKSEEPWVSIHNKCYYATPVCRYAHELQHALRLCGIEKEIIL